MKMLPADRPQWKRERVIEFLELNGVSLVKPAILFVRGYFMDSMGKPDQNDRALYDDAAFIYTPTGLVAYNANTDPTRYKHGVAMIKPGVYPFRQGWHKWGKKGAHRAFRPATPDEALPVFRDGIEKPRPGIACNIHKGSAFHTSSEGCLTLPPNQWDDFRITGYSVMDSHNMDIIPVCLIEQQG